MERRPVEYDTGLGELLHLRDEGTGSGHLDRDIHISLTSPVAPPRGLIGAGVSIIVLSLARGRSELLA